VLYKWVTESSAGLFLTVGFWRCIISDRILVLGRKVGQLGFSQLRPVPSAVGLGNPCQIHPPDRPTRGGCWLAHAADLAVQVARA